ncbi:2'-5' RNA ligase family protein [Antarcticibacterium arcticum]|nr:2'-5' RNA ligase family protein [Antarcticibacterium arcticum]
MKQFFIALVPENDLKLKLEEIKNSFAKTYNSHHALKLPPHITLIPPFKMQQEAEVTLIQVLRQTAENTNNFELQLNGFGAFPPRVIFIDVINSFALTNLFNRLYVNAQPLFPAKPQREYHPHITIATRDLKKQKFEEAWSVFRERDFIDIFPVHSLFLLGHNGRTWEILNEFPFAPEA